MRENWHSLTKEKTAKILKTNLQKGLSREEVEKKLEVFGLNSLPKKEPLSKLRIFLKQFKSPLVYILVIAGIITLILNEFNDAIIIFAAVILNTIVGFIQENKATNTFEKLRNILHLKAVVLREGREKEIDQEKVVPGDIVILKNGGKVPADGRIIESSNLKINEAALTGEWVSADKKTEPIAKEEPLADRDNMAYMGTIVSNGEGKMLVTGTGRETELGKISEMIKTTKKEKTPYQKKLIILSKIIGIIILVLTFIIFIGGLLANRGFKEMFTTSIALAVAAIPEGLPVSLTVILAIGMQKILKKRGLVRKLSSAETLGNTSIIATDKTLTLTEGKMVVEEIIGENERRILEAAVLCNEAFIENPEKLGPFWKIRGRPTDKALLMAGAEKDIFKHKLEEKRKKIEEIPFNNENKFIATLHRGEGENILSISGAPEKIIEISDLSDEEKRKKTEKLKSMAKKGLRIIALGQKRIKEDKIEEIDDLEFLGFIGLKDPLRKGIKKSIDLCRQAGMNPIIVTGDHLLTARAIARELGIKADKKNIIEGREMEKMSDRELSEKLDKIKVFARVEPAHKLRIIEAWQSKNKVIAMTGDGINDAPALKKADIGVALGSGTDVAKDISDLVLLNDNFSVIVTAIKQGRIILDNIRKVITYLLSSSFTELILIGIALIFNLPLPVTAVQILWVNIIEDGPLGLCLAFEPGEKDIMKQKPKDHKISLLNSEMKSLIFIIGFITDLFLLGLFFFLVNHSHYAIEHIRTIIFAGLTIDSIFYIFSCKSLRKNIWQIKPFSNKYLVGAWFLGVVMLLLSIYIPLFQNLLKTVPLNFYDWQLIFGIGFSNIILIELTKYFFINKDKKNL